MRASAPPIRSAPVDAESLHIGIEIAELVLRKILPGSSAFAVLVISITAARVLI